jgi:hypothetical protein
MIAATVAIAATAFAPVYSARTDESHRLTIAVHHGRVTRVATTVVRYECDQFGDVGPLHIRVEPNARIDRRGRFSAVAGTRAERVGIAGRVGPNGAATGRIRVSGTIGTGERCASPVIRFRSR